jgi:hypothetical protein
VQQPPAPDWLTVACALTLGLGLAAAAAIIFDIASGRRQRMRVMEFVWPVTALYLGPLAWWAYRRWGRTGASYGEPVSVALGVSHCGAGCTLGDIVGAWVVFVGGLKVLGLALYAEYLVNFAIAFVLGIAFQYASIKPMRELGVREGIVAALKADTLSLLAFEVGVFAWMALMQLVFFPGPHLHPDTVAYWGLMQVAMLLGFATSYPANVWLIRRGIKEPM